MLFLPSPESSELKYRTPVPCKLGVVGFFGQDADVIFQASGPPSHYTDADWTTQIYAPSLRDAELYVASIRAERAKTCPAYIAYFDQQMMARIDAEREAAIAAHVREYMTPRELLRVEAARKEIHAAVRGATIPRDGAASQWAERSVIDAAKKILKGRADRRAARLVAESARSSRINPPPQWTPVLLKMTHEVSEVEEGLLHGLRNRNKPEAGERSRREDYSEGRYSSRCSYQKISHTPVIECHGWVLRHAGGRHWLRWIIDGNRGRMAGQCRLRRGQKIPDSATLIGDRAPHKYIARDNAEGMDGWRKLVAAQHEAGLIARAVAAGRKIALPRLMAIADAHARMEAVEACGGLARVEGSLPVVEKTTDGTLVQAESILPGLRLLVVRCPSTGATYALKVPEKTRTVRAALKFVNGIDATAIVAHA